MAYQKQNLKQDIRIKKNPSTTKSTKMTRSYRMKSGNIKASKEEPVLGQSNHTMLTQNGAYYA